MGIREKVSHVTVSGNCGDKGKGVTCNGFWGLGGTRAKVSHVGVSAVYFGNLGLWDFWTSGLLYVGTFVSLDFWSVGLWDFLIF